MKEISGIEISTNEKSKIFRWFNCIAYSILAALIARIVIFPAGVLEEADKTVG